MNSSRLPGKVLTEIEGVPSILYQINRIKPVLSEDIGLVVATTNTPKDDILCNLLNKNKIKFYRGEEDNVLDRFAQCSLQYNSEFVIRLNADCPLICPQLIKEVIDKMKNSNFDYASTILDETYPLGMHIEIMKSKTLRSINKLKLSPELREHVTPFIYRNKEKFNLLSIADEINNSNLRITVDYPEDLEVVKEIASYFRGRKFYLKDIIKFLNSNPKISKKNSALLKSQKLN